MENWVIGEVVRTKFWTDVLFSVIIHAPVQPFIAGQFTKIRLKINGEYMQRAYSYVNAPNSSDLEFYLVVVQKGRFSPYLAALQPGDKIQIMREAAGSFILKEIPSCSTLWMLATGTAIGPYLSILTHGRDLERFTNIVLVHAARYAADLSYLPKMLELQKYYKGKLKIQTVVSREEIQGSLIGRIPELIDNHELESAVGLSIDIETSHVMLCGNPQMVRDTQQLLNKKKNMKKHLRRHPGHITTENYW